MNDPFITAAVLSVAVGCFSFTLTKAKISSPFRVWIAGKTGKAWEWASDLFMCPFCVSHWLAFAAVGYYRPWLVPGPVPLQFVITSLAVVGAAMLTTLIIKKTVT
jgi:Protein of unknown function (DUF1360)